MKTFDYSPEVRWSDQDLLGHVNNARILTLVEEARIKWLHEVRLIRLSGGGLLVAHQSIDYLVPVMYGPELKLTMTVAKIGTSSFTVRTRGEQSGKQAFDTTVVLVHIDRETGRPMPLGDDVRGFLEDYASS